MLFRSAPAPRASAQPSAPRTVAQVPVARPAPAAPQSRAAAPSLAAQAARAAANVAAVPQPKPAPASGNFKDALLAEIKKGKAAFYNMVVAQAQKIDVTGDRVTFSFTPAQRALKDNFEQQKAWLEALALAVAGRKITMASAAADPSAAPPPAAEPAAAGKAPEKQSAEKKSALREQALADAGVQTMLEVFPAEIRDVEEM